MHWNYDLAALPQVAAAVLKELGGPCTVAIYGPMGAGKTTLVHALCDALGVQDAVGSPTFSIINEYAFPDGLVFHIDCYRLRDEQEAMDAGVEDALYSGDWCFVEWPEKIPEILPAEIAIIKIRPINATMRSLDLEIKL